MLVLPQRVRKFQHVLVLPQRVRKSLRLLLLPQRARKYEPLAELLHHLQGNILQHRVRKYV